MAGAVIANAAMPDIAAHEWRELQTDRTSRYCWYRQSFYSIHDATGHSDRHQADHSISKISLLPGFGLKVLLYRHMREAVAENLRAHHKIVQ